MDGITKKNEKTNQPIEITVYLCATDWSHEVGKGRSHGPHKVYNSLEEIRKKRKCVNIQPLTDAEGNKLNSDFGCGVVKAKLVFEKFIPAVEEN